MTSHGKADFYENKRQKRSQDKSFSVTDKIRNPGGHGKLWNFTSSKDYKPCRHLGHSWQTKNVLT